MKKRINCLYIIEFEHGFKIGVAKDFVTRLHSYTRPWCYPIKNVWIYKCQYPRHYELNLIKYFKNHLKDNSREFISNTTIENIINAIESLKAKSSNGFTRDNYFNQFKVEKYNLTRTTQV